VAVWGVGELVAPEAPEAREVAVLEDEDPEGEDQVVVGRGRVGGVPPRKCQPAAQNRPGPQVVIPAAKGEVGG
jgi:hypothetical protein